MSAFGRRLAAALVALVSLAVLVFIAIAWDIVSYGDRSSDSRADAAVVLGAAAWGNKPSPVYRERIREAVALYESGRVRYLVFTGGTPVAGYPAEGSVGREFAVAHGVPAAAILTETTSRTTLQNLGNAKALIESAGIHSVLLVSDPLHMRRAMALASSIGLNAMPAPTPTSRFQSSTSRAAFLWRESWLYIDYLVFGNPS
jgi:uncharacterized SAM-binding protein YcdF (DUF218 family)